MMMAQKNNKLVKLNQQNILTKQKRLVYSIPPVSHIANLCP